MPNLIGQSLGRYHILEQLGEGGMATVYKAYDTRLERDVAIKIIRSDAFPLNQLERILKRFEREAKSLAKLSHPNIVGVIDYGEHAGAPYLVLVYLRGGTLKARMGQPMPWPEAARLLIPVANALEYAHEHKVIHRDVKPANILLTEKGQPMLTDFGIAKILEMEDGQTLTGTGVGIGTPEYMAPEQGLGKEVDGRADIYSLGIIFYELLTGRKPYNADTPMAVIFKHLSDPLPRPRQFIPDLPDAVERVLIKALAKNPQERYSDAGAFAVALERLLAGSPAMASNSLPQGEMVSPVRDSTQDTTDQLDEAPRPPLQEPKFTPLPKISQDEKNTTSRTLRLWQAAAIGLMALMCLVLLVGGVFWLTNRATVPTQVPTRALASHQPATQATTSAPPTATQMIASTSTPRATATLFTSQDILIEDHFDIQKFDGSYNGLLWNCGGCLPELVFQKDGVLRINRPSSTEATSRDLSSRNSWTFAKIGYIQARLKLENYEGNRHADVHAQLWADFQDYRWWTSCDVLMESSLSSKGYFNCHIGRFYSNGSVTGDYSTPLISIDTNKWQAVRIEIEPETFQLKFYLNGELIGEKVPSDANILKAKTLTPVFGIWTDGVSSFTAYLDDLIVGSR